MSMSPAVQPLHILRKDAMHLWPETVISIALLAVFAWIDVQTWAPTREGFNPASPWCWLKLDPWAWLCFFPLHGWCSSRAWCTTKSSSATASSGSPAPTPGTACLVRSCLPSSFSSACRSSSCRSGFCITPACIPQQVVLIGAVEEPVSRMIVGLVSPSASTGHRRRNRDLHPLYLVGSRRSHLPLRRLHHRRLFLWEISLDAQLMSTSLLIACTLLLLILVVSLWSSSMRGARRSSHVSCSLRCRWSSSSSRLITPVNLFSAHRYPDVSVGKVNFWIQCCQPPPAVRGPPLHRAYLRAQEHHQSPRAGGILGNACLNDSYVEVQRFRVEITGPNAFHSISDWSATSSASYPGLRASSPASSRIQPARKSLSADSRPARRHSFPARHADHVCRHTVHRYCDGEAIPRSWPWLLHHLHSRWQPRLPVPLR